MKQINILVLVTALERNALGSVVLNYIRNIDRKKIKFDLLVRTQKDGDLEQEFLKLGCEVFYMKNASSDGKYKSELSRFLRETEPYDIVHSFLTESSESAFKVAKNFHISTRIAYVSTIEEAIAMKKKKGDTFTHMIVVNDENKEGLLKKVAADNVFYVKNPVDVAEFQYDINKSMELRKELGITANQLVFTHVGRMNSYENQNFVAEIFHELKEIHNAILLFVGNEYNKKENHNVKIVEQFAQRYGMENRVKFLGIRNDMDKILSATDIVLAPLKKQSFPITLLEAQASGAKIFASEFVDEKVNVTESIHFISLKRSARAWACEIMNCVSNEEHRMLSNDEQVKGRQKLSDNNCNVILRKGYDIMENAKKIQKLYIESMRGNEI